MDNDNDHERRVTKRGRISLPNALGIQPSGNGRGQAEHLPRPSNERCIMPHDEEWLEVLLKRWMSLTPEVRVQLQIYMSLTPGDRKNQRRLEKKLKTAACK